MRKLNYELKWLCIGNREGSHVTQASRKRILMLIADQLHALGFPNTGVHSLRPKHVQRLVEVWKNGHDALGWKPVSIGTVKNRLAQLRWWAGKANKAGVVAKSNAYYGIGNHALGGSPDV
ncbi:MAG: phage integrase N-terminal domain-containing protein [Gammaproteobacteria bacterium]